MSQIPAVRINRKGSDRARSGHPWIFASDVLDAGSAEPGDVVRVVDHAGKLIGTGHYSSTSQIRVRLLSARAEPVDQSFLRSRIEGAKRYRGRIVTSTNAYRLVYGEADLLPGLIVDRYADWLSVQFLTQGMDRLAREIVRVLSELVQPKGILARNDVPIRAKENLAQEVTVLAGEVPDSVAVDINALRFNLNLKTGQKTAAFLDQRENYLVSRRYAMGQALDCFTASGGFALHLASVCENVEAVDSSAQVLTQAENNAAANGITNVVFRNADVLEYLPSLVSARRSFDIVVLDPPAFAKARSGLEGAARGYKEINLRALRLLRSGGVLVTCSCSHHMSEAHLLEVIAAASLDCGKQVRVLERRTQSQDHPILLTVPETHYLKCLILEVI
jgi:23S rRNA (cytosine1962-C5)-methyltransferase